MMGVSKRNEIGGKKKEERERERERESTSLAQVL